MLPSIPQMVSLKYFHRWAKKTPQILIDRPIGAITACVNNASFFIHDHYVYKYPLVYVMIVDNKRR